MTHPVRVNPEAPVSRRAFARMLGCDPRTVRAAIRSGRIPRAFVTADGRISDPAAAAAAMRANTLADRVPLTGPTAPSGRADDAPDLTEARTRHEHARAQLAEIEVEHRRRELVEVAELDARLPGALAACRARLLEIPERARRAGVGLSPGQVAIVEALVVEALADLAEERLEAGAA